MLFEKVYSEPKIQEKYLYDDQEIRIKKESGDIATYYFSQDHEAIYSNDLFLKSINYINANDQKIAKVENNVIKYRYTDYLGSATKIANTSGSSDKSIWYSPFGTEVASQGEAIVKYKYTDQEQDDTGLYYYGARYYDTGLARFSAADSWLPDRYDSQQLNRFAYVMNNPIKLVDPTGHFRIMVLLERTRKDINISFGIETANGFNIDYYENGELVDSAFQNDSPYNSLSDEEIAALRYSIEEEEQRYIDKLLGKKKGIQVLSKDAVDKFDSETMKKLKMIEEISVATGLQGEWSLRNEKWTKHGIERAYEGLVDRNPLRDIGSVDAIRKWGEVFEDKNRNSIIYHYNGNVLIESAYSGERLTQYRLGVNINDWADFNNWDERNVRDIDLGDVNY